MRYESPAPSITSERKPLAACPLCAGRRLHYAFSKSGHRVVRCVDCRFMLLNPQPSDAELAAIYGAAYFIGSNTERVAEMKSATAERYLGLIQRYRGAHHGRLLEIGCGHGELLVRAKQVGYDVTGVEVSAAAVEIARSKLGTSEAIVCGDIDSAGLPAGVFDVCVLADVVEHVRDPIDFLRTVRRLLKSDGVLLIAMPSLDSWSARMLRQNWMEFKPEHLSYFDVNTIQNALHQSGYRSVLVSPGWKVLNLDYVAGHFARFPVPVVTGVVRLVARLTPGRLRAKNVPVVASGMVVLARAGAEVSNRTLSVIVPAYNEAATLAAMLGPLLLKEIPGVDIEVVLVESNSTDGTRAIAESYRDHPRVRLVLEDRPRGKGHAVRAGLAHATGDWVLIQDADLEYDLNDYDALLEPLRAGREAFVLGSRHGGNAWWKMRSFTRQPLLSFFLNSGHWFFTTLLNVLFRQRLRDPFTMFKVFRRDCLYGLTFQCDRFDFDIELLVKLLRKGYRPLEIPVNYRSRSFKQGKKVTIFRDPLTWLRAIVRLRLSRQDPLAEIERQRCLRHDGGNLPLQLPTPP
jgi:SAM-dependent methyltransferase